MDHLNLKGIKYLLIIFTTTISLGCTTTQSPEPTQAKLPIISIHRAAIEGNLKVVKQHLAAGTDVNVKDSSGLTVLHAVRFDQKVITEVLIKNGADLNARNIYEETLLHLAVYNSHIGFVKLLIANNAELNAKDLRGLTPLHRAAVLGLKEIAALLITEGADVNAKDRNSETPLDWADEEIVDLLRRYGGKTAEELKLLVNRAVEPSMNNYFVVVDSQSSNI